MGAAASNAPHAEARSPRSPAGHLGMRPSSAWAPVVVEAAYLIDKSLVIVPALISSVGRLGGG